MHTRSGARLQNDILKLNFYFLFYQVTLELIIEKQKKPKENPTQVSAELAILVHSLLLKFIN